MRGFSWLALLWLVRLALANCPASCRCEPNQVLCENVPSEQLGGLLDELAAMPELPSRLTVRNCTKPLSELKLVFPAALKLKRLELSNCQIGRLGPGTLDKQVGLEELSLAGNNFKSIPFLGKLTKLRSLNLGRNQISTIADGSLANLDELTHLRLKHNNITKIPTNALSEVKSHLAVLDLSHNGLSTVPAQNLRNSVKLTHLDLSFNKIAAVQQLEFMNLVQLQELRLSHNGLTQISPKAFINVPGLSRIDLNDNQLSNFNPELLLAFHDLKHIDLSRNAITKAPSFKDFSQLRNVQLTGNKISKLDTMTFSANPELIVINLNDNDISVISRNAFDSLPKLKNLQLAKNALKTIAKGSLDGIPSLKQLELTNNSISELSADSFTALPELSVVDLSGNHLQDIVKGTFLNNTKLFWVDLSNNQLRSIENGAFEGKVGNILLNGNELTCDGKLDWFLRYLVLNNVRTFLPEQPEVTCAAPPENRGTRLKDLLIQKANDTLTQSMQKLGLGAGQAQGQPSDLLARLLPALSGAGGASDMAPVLGTLTQAIPSLRNIPGLAMQNAPNMADPSSRNLDLAVDQFAEPLVRMASGGKPLPSDINRLIKSIPNLVVNIPGVGDVDVNKLPPSLVEHVLKGGQIPGVPRETLQAVVQQYMQRMYAAAAHAQGKPVDQVVLENVPNIADLDRNKYLKPISDLPSQLVTDVMKGGSLPYLTPSQTDVIKTFYTQGMPLETANGTGPSPTGFNPNVLQMMKLLPPGYDLSRLPQEVMQSVLRGEIPDLNLLPKDLQTYIRDNMDTMFKTFSNQPSLSIDEILKKLPKFDQVELNTFSPYDINNIDSDLVVKDDTAKLQSMRFYIAVAVGFVSAITVLGLVVLCVVVRKQQNAVAENPEGPISSSTPRRAKLSFDETEQLERSVRQQSFGTPPFRQNLDDSALHHRHNMSSSHQYV